MSKRIITPHIWYFPSNYGDIRLEDVGGGKGTKVIWFRLTALEAQAMKSLRKASLHGRRKWATAEDWDNLGDNIFETDVASEIHLELKAPLGKVADQLTRVLRPERATVHVMRIGQGKIEEVRTSDFVDDVSDADADAGGKEDSPFRKEAKEDSKALAKTGSDDIAKVTTVKKPVRGCPAPSFEQVRLRATRVLRAFLSPEQVEDFEQYQQFVTVGADTGHQYMLTSRNAPDDLSRYGGRCVFDLDENRAYCVHDWDIPAEEELLTLHCLLSLPGYETWARGIPACDMA